MPNLFKDYKSYKLPIVYLIVFIIFLLLPSLIYFTSIKPDFTNVFLNAEDINGKLIFIKSRYKILGALPWITVAITAILIMGGNTIIYFCLFTKEMFHEKIESTAKYYYLTLGAFIAWILAFFIYGIITTVNFMKLRSSIFDSSRTANLIVDRKTPDDTLFTVLSNYLDDFIHQLDLYIVFTVLLFIVIDSFTISIKNIQIDNEKTKRKLILRYERDFAINQLLVIDIPIIVGIFLIWLFTSHLSETDIDKNSKSIFTIGGVAMHIILSQIIFLMLASKASYREARILDKIKPKAKPSENLSNSSSQH